MEAVKAKQSCLIEKRLANLKKNFFLVLISTNTNYIT